MLPFTVHAELLEGAAAEAFLPCSGDFSFAAGATLVVKVLPFGLTDLFILKFKKDFPYLQHLSFHQTHGLQLF